VAQRGDSVNSLLHRAIISSSFDAESAHGLAGADGIFVSCRLDTLHYAGVNVYSLRLGATRGRHRRRASRRGTRPRDKCRFSPYFTSRLTLAFRSSRHSRRNAPRVHPGPSSRRSFQGNPNTFDDDTFISPRCVDGRTMDGPN